MKVACVQALLAATHAWNSQRQSHLEAAEQRLCIYLQNGEHAANVGDSIDALMWFDAAVAEVHRVPPMLAQLMAHAHKANPTLLLIVMCGVQLLSRMSRSLERGRAVEACSNLTQNIKRRSVVSTCLTELNKEHNCQLQKVLHEIREHLYECVFEGSLDALEPAIDVGEDEKLKD